MHTDLSGEERDKVIDVIARGIVERRLEAPAVMFLEMHKPVAFLASQAMLVTMPMLAPLLGTDIMAQISRLLRNKENIDLLIKHIEDISADKVELPAEIKG